MICLFYSTSRPANSAFVLRSCSLTSMHDPVTVSYTVLAGVLVNDNNKFSLRRPSHAQQALVDVK